MCEGSAPGAAEPWGPEVPSQEGPRNAKCARCQGHASPCAFPSISCLGLKTWQDWVGTLNHQPLFSWGDSRPIWPQWAFLFLVVPSPPRRNLRCEGEIRSRAPGKGGRLPGAWLGAASHLPCSDAWRSAPSTFSDLSLLWQLAFPRKPTPPPPKSFVCYFLCPQRMEASLC